MKFLRLFSVATVILFATAGFAAGKGPAKASVEVTSTQDKGSAKLLFKTIPANGLVINHEGPWKLEIKSVTGVKPAVTELKRADWKEATAGFELPVTVDAKSKTADVQFKLTSFVCTKDKTQCYREVIEDKATVKL